MHLTSAADSERPRRSRWIVAELDARGEIDDHAAMCMRFAIEAGCESADAMIRVDLRDLAAIDGGRLSLFVECNAGCRARGVRLELLISADARHDAIAGAFNAAGLGGQLRFTAEPHESRPPAQAPGRRTVPVVALPAPTRPARARLPDGRSRHPRH